MKNILWAMAVLFAILAIVCYSNSIISTGYGSYKTEVANVQLTVFAAACAVLCGVNIVGALILSAIDSITIPPQASSENIANSVVYAIKKASGEKKDQEKEESRPNHDTDLGQETKTIIAEANDSSRGFKVISTKEIMCNTCGSIQPITRKGGICWKCRTKFQEG